MKILLFLILLKKSKYFLQLFMFLVVFRNIPRIYIGFLKTTKNKFLIFIFIFILFQHKQKIGSQVVLRNVNTFKMKIKYYMQTFLFLFLFLFCYFCNYLKSFYVAILKRKKIDVYFNSCLHILSLVVPSLTTISWS